MTGIMKEWTKEIGLRHQGILVSAIRGGDANAKDDPTKDLIKAYRDVILVSFDEKPSRFIEKVSLDELKLRMKKVLDSFDHYPMHFLLHIIFASEVIGYKHPDEEIRNIWKWFYETFVYKIHLNPETEEQMDSRLTCNAKEFASHDTRCYYH